MKEILPLVTVTVLFCLVGCGGGDDDSTQTTTTDTPSASTPTVLPPLSQTWSPDGSMAGITLGDTLATVKTILGEPSHYSLSQTPPFQISGAQYPSIKLGVYFPQSSGAQLDQATVTKLQTYNGSDSTLIPYSYQGVTGGTSRDEVYRVLGNPTRVSEDSGNALWINYGGRGVYVGVDFENNRVRLIDVSLTP